MNESDEIRGEHPLVSGKYICKSQPMNRLCSALKGALSFNIPSLMCPGERRLGKSTAAMFIASNPQLTLGGRYSVVLHSCRPSEPTWTSGIFYGQILSSMRHPQAVKSMAPLKRFELLALTMSERASRSVGSTIVFILDEADSLTFREYSWLIALHNEVTGKFGVKMFYLLLGQPALENQRTAYLVEKQRQITGRFMAQKLEYTGLMSAGEVEYCAGQFDSQLRWPEGGGSFSETYAPTAFGEGWRYAQHSGDVWNAFLNHSKGGVRDFGISMTSFALVSGFLYRQVATKKGFSGFKLADIKKAVEKLAYLELPIAEEGSPASEE